MRTCDTMNHREASIALSVTDIPLDGYMEDRLSRIRDLSEEIGCLRCICVRNDSRDPFLFALAAEAASGTGLELILESDDPVCLREALLAVGRTDVLMVMTDRARLAESATLSALSGCLIAVPGSDVESLLESAEEAVAAGAPGVVLNPSVRNMKGCLEMCTDLYRLSTEHSFPAAMHPVMVRTWSGEYALAVASVAFMRHCSLVVFDDLDPEGCRVIDALIRGVQP